MKEADRMRKCPYCAEDIQEAAVRCPHCRSRIAALDPNRWYRDHPERRVAGVAAAISHVLAVPVTIVRVGFVVLTFVHLIGPLVYLALWMLIPVVPGTPSPAERALGTAQRWIAALRGDPRDTRNHVSGGAAP
jgi:phage shock protein PspC (stress-responsive transcriptional regulator)